MQDAAQGKPGIEQVADFRQTKGHRGCGLNGCSHYLAGVSRHTRGDVETQNRFFAVIDQLDDLALQTADLSA